MNQMPGTIERIIQRVRRRLRLQQATRWLVRAVAASSAILLFGLLAVRLYWLSPATVLTLAAVLLGVCIVAFFGGLLGRYDRVALAQRLDQSHDLKDRLGTAVALLTEDSEFAVAQRREAERHIHTIDLRRAAPWFLPPETLAVMGLLGLIWVVTSFWPNTWIPTTDKAVVPLIALTSPPAAEEPPEPLALDAEDIDILDLKTEGVSDEWKELAQSDPELARFVQEMNDVLERIAEGKMTAKEVAETTAALEEKAEALAGQPEELAAQEALAEKFDAVADEIEKAAKKLKQKDLEKLAQLLEERRYEEAGALFEKLFEKFLKLPPKEQKRLAKAFEKLAKKFKSKFGNQLDKAKKKNRLARKENEGPGKSPKRQSRLNRAKKQLDRMQRQYDRKTTEAQKELDRLSRAMQKAADRLRRQQPNQKRLGQGQKNQPKAAEQSRRMDKKTMKELTEAIKRLGKQKKRSRLGRMGKMRMADLKELLRRRRGNGQEKKRGRLARLRRGKLGKGQGGGDTKPGQGSGGLERKGIEWMQMNRSGKRGPVSQKQARIGEGIGQGHHPLSHRRGTELSGAKTRPDFVPGQQGKGPTKVEVLYGAATEGTRVKGYGPIHIDYSMRASRQMADEEVPPGYRSVVEQYFRLIRK